MTDKRYALTLIRQKNPYLGFKRDDEITMSIRRDMADALYREMDSTARMNSNGLGRLVSWLRGGKTAAQTRYEGELTQKELAILGRIRIQIAAQYGITPEMLDEFTRLKFQYQAQNWLAEQEHGRQIDLIETQGKIERINLINATDQEIRRIKAIASEERRNKRSQIFWETAQFLVKTLIEVGSEIVKTQQQREQLENQIRYAANHDGLVSDFIIQRKMEEARILKQQIKTARSSFERQLYQGRLEQILKELGIEIRPKGRPGKTSHGKNTRRTYKTPDPRRNYGKGSKNRRRGRGKKRGTDHTGPVS
jgi:hypothetical protein